MVVAEALLGTPTSTAGNPWWLYLDQAFIRANPGYEVLVGAFFLLFLPLSIALNSAAFSVAVLLCTPPELRALAASNGPSDAPGAAAAAGPAPAHRRGAAGAAAGVPHVTRKPGGPLPLFSLEDDPSAAALADIGIQAVPHSSLPLSPPPRHPAEGSSADAASASAAAAAALTASTLPAERAAAGADSGGPLNTLRAALASIAAVLPEAPASVRRVWWADMHLNARALPLQGLCLLVLPALWAVPRLLRLQLTLPAAALEGRTGRDAIERSGALMGSSLAAYGMPFALLLGAGRLLEYVQTVAMALIPPRWWRDVVEVPLLVAGAFLLVKACVARLQDLLPLATYMELAEQEADSRRKQQEQVAAAMLLQEPPQQPQAHGKEANGAAGAGPALTHAAAAAVAPAAA
ncbi:hypothetical protein GPECTOR_52g30 [Gonium pectorale]|uniref:Uncharacterized protein n=1 Tax=Gonium pectorale TaxID=33097 RepID=A0A150G6Y6_GONPE|nr:hypothetical protein GPECTOR_52g30 [Gonium pectorale]|eukprot:KXZ45629.1 hypothetical protein GPECTOR_52g30 [Gonium pectorale]